MRIKYRHTLIFIAIFLIFIAGYFIIQSLNKKENPLPNISDANINESINLNATTSTNSSDEILETANANTGSTQPLNTNQTGEVDPDAVLFDKAYTAGDREICEQIISEPSKLLCNVYIINAKAKSEKNIKLCEEITDEFYRNDCHDNVIMVIATQEKNKEKCNELIDQKRFDECAAGAR